MRENNKNNNINSNKQKNICIYHKSYFEKT